MMTYLFEKSCPKFNVNLENKYIIKWIKRLRLIFRCCVTDTDGAGALKAMTL